MLNIAHAATQRSNVQLLEALQGSVLNVRSGVVTELGHRVVPRH